MQPFKRKEKPTSTELLLGIYLTKLNEEERRRKGFGAVSSGLVEGRGPTSLTLSPFPFLLQGQSRSMTDCHVDWAHLDFSYSILTPFNLPHTLHFFSHGALISTDQAFNLVMMEDSMLSYAYRTERKYIYIYKSVYYELCKNIFKGMVMFFFICEFSYEILYESSIHLIF